MQTVKSTSIERVAESKAKIRLGAEKLEGGEVADRRAEIENLLRISTLCRQAPDINVERMRLDTFQKKHIPIKNREARRKQKIKQQKFAQGQQSKLRARVKSRKQAEIRTVEAGQGLIHSPGHDAWTIARAADRAEDVGYVRALQASEHRMMTSIKEVNLRVSYQAQVRRRESEDFYTQLLNAQTDSIDIRLEIDVVRG
ncbi:hypothetical protein Tco_1095506 [Tanacetum coccineum]